MTLRLISGMLAISIMSAIGGDYLITTDPAADASTGSKYIVLNFNDAYLTGVGFSAAISSLQYGHVENWDWTFFNGVPTSSDQQNPGTVTYNFSAYGMSNPVLLTFCHYGSNGEVCSNPSNNNMQVNVIKPTVGFNYTQWSGNDGAVANADRTYGTTFNIGQKNTFTKNGIFYVLYPYEYQVSALPYNSDAVSTDLDLTESSDIYVTYYNATGEDVPNSYGPLPKTFWYRPGDGFAPPAGGPGFVYDVPVTAPTSPTMYAVDCPGPAQADQYQSNMATFGDNKVIITLVISSIPTFQASLPHQNPVDYLLEVTHTYTYTYTTAAGWSVSHS